MKFKLFSLMFICIILISSVSSFELNPFATKKVVDEITKINKSDFMLQELSDYPIIKLSKTLFWIETDRIAEYKIVENSCGFTNCVMNIKVRTYSDEVLFDDEMKYLDMKKGGETLLDTQYYIRGEDQTYLVDVNDYKYTNCRNVYDNITEITSEKCDETFLGTHKEERIRETWTQYNQEVLPSGEYEIELRGKIEVGQSVDVIPYAQNKEFTEWAVWTSALNVDLMTYLSFDDNSGLTANNSLTPLLFNGTIGNAIQWNSTNKKLGDSAIQIKDEVDRMAHINDNVILDSTEGFSFNTWAYRFDGSADNKVMGQETGGLFFGYDASNVLGVSIRGVGSVSTPANTSIRVWEMISLIVSSGNYSIYRNGVIEATGDIAGYAGSGFVRIGNIDNSDSTVSMFKGTLDEMAFWNRTLTDQEVLDLWNDGDALPFVADIALTATLSSPVDDFSTVDTTPDLSCNFTSSGSVNIANVTIEVYDSSNNLDYTDTDTTPGGTTKSFNKTWTTTSLSLDTYNWSCSAFGDDTSNATTSNRTINIVVPTVTLNSPIDNFEAATIDNEFNISANLFDSSTIKNMSLFTNKSGIFEATEILIFSSFGLEKENLTEVSSLSTGFELVKNITYNNYTHNVTNDIGSSSAISHTISSTTRYVYEDSTFLDVNFSKLSSSATFTFVEYINPSPNKKVNNIEIYIKTSSGSNDVREKNTKIFGNEVSSSTEIFNTTITQTTLWAGQVCGRNGICIFSNENRTIIIDETDPVINLTAPPGAIESIVIGNNLSLNWTVSDTNLDTCLFTYNNINTTVTCADNNYSFITIQDEQSIIFYANDTFNNLASNTTSWTYDFIENNVTFNDIVFETSNQNFILNLTTDETILSISGVMNYDSIDHLSIISCEGQTCVLSNNIDIPLVDSGPNQTNNFFWNFTIFNGTSSNNIQTSTRQQIVNKTFLEICNGTHTIETLNFTAFDEINITQLGSFDFEATFEFWIGGGTVTRNNTFSESGVEVNLCMKDALNYSTTATIDYDESGNTSTYVSRFYYFDNHSIDSTRQDIPLFLLQSAFSTSFILKVQDENLLPVVGALITTQRCYADEIDCRTVQIALTDENGKSIGFFQTETVDYKFIITKNGEILLETGKQKVVPETSPFTLTFNTGDDLGEPWAGQNEIPSLNSTLVFDKDTGIVTYVYIDTSSNFTSATLNVTRNSLSNSSATISVCNEISTLASSTIFCDVGNTTGFYTATGFITRSGTGLDKQISFQIENISSIVGLLGLFFGWFLILVSMFMFKFNEIAGIWITTITITLINISGLIKFGTVFVTSIIVLSVIITWLLER